MKLNVLERLLGIGAVAQYEMQHPKGNFITLKLVNGLQNKLLVSEEETIKYDLHIEDDQYKWNDLGSTEYIDFEFTEGETKIITEGLISLHNQNQLTKDHFSIIDKFISNPEEVLKPITE